MDLPPVMCAVFLIFKSFWLNVRPEEISLLPLLGITREWCVFMIKVENRLEGKRKSIALYCLILNKIAYKLILTRGFHPFK
jgi:hypothetical protein